jgi:hypothetical protein
MGYYVETTEMYAVIPADRMDDAYRRLCALNHSPTADKHGGAIQGGKIVSSYFSWMEADYDEKYKDAVEILNQVGFTDTYTDENGDLVLGGYNNKTGDEDQFINSISPCFTEDSFINWRGEDAEMYRWELGNASIMVKEASVVWSDGSAMPRAELPVPANVAPVTKTKSAASASSGAQGRQPKGTTVGGQFAPKRNAEATVELGNIGDLI